MASNIITVNNLLQTGRTTAQPPSPNPAMVRYNADFSANADTTYNFPFVVASTQDIFGVPKSIFVDNTNNPNVIDVMVSGTGQFFPIPAGSAGFFDITAQAGSTISLESLGNATGPIAVEFYNYPKEPIVWYKTGIPIGGTVAVNLTEVLGQPVGVGHGVATGAIRVELPTDGTGQIATIVNPIHLYGKDNNNAMSVANPLAVQTSFLYKHIATSTTTLVKSGAGVLKGVTINTKGTVASTTTIYDSLTATGAIVAIIDSLNLEGQFEYDIEFGIGLTIVTTGTIAPDITASYR